MHGIDRQMETSAYKYTPFEHDYSVRILTLGPGVGDEPLVGHLNFENLDNSPRYEAISYVWGTGTRSSWITCDGKILPLTQSVHSALQRMRLPSRTRRLWADQVCINQNDLRERSQQVRLMNAIYKDAQHILVWLGPEDEGVAEEAVTMISYLHGVFTQEEMHNEFKLAHSEALWKQDRDPWVPLSKLTRLSWVSFQSTLLLAVNS